MQTQDAGTKQQKTSIGSQKNRRIYKAERDTQANIIRCIFMQILHVVLQSTQAYKALEWESYIAILVCQRATPPAQCPAWYCLSPHCLLDVVHPAFPRYGP